MILLNPGCRRAPPTRLLVHVLTWRKPHTLEPNPPKPFMSNPGHWCASDTFPGARPDALYPTHPPLDVNNVPIPLALGTGGGNVESYHVDSYYSVE